MEKQFLPEVIKSTRITLKKHSKELAQQMFEYVVEDRERLSEFLPWPKLIQTVEDEITYIEESHKSWENHQSSSYGIFRNDDHEYLGNIEAFAYNWTNESCEIGYWILGKFEGQGYMSEAVLTLEDALFKTGFNRIVIRFNPVNDRSGSIPRRLGYVREGRLRQATNINGIFQDLEVFSKIKSDLKS